jgi:alpha-glucoside transport system permease protein
VGVAHPSTTGAGMSEIQRKSLSDGPLKVTNPGQLILFVGLLIATLEVFRRIFVFLKAGDAPFSLTFAVSIVWGVGGVVVLFYLLNTIVEQFNQDIKKRVLPWLFVGPTLLLLGYFLFVPTLRTLYSSFFDASSQKFVGLNNYAYALTSPSMLESYRNNLVWLIFGAGLCILFGLLIATLADRTHPMFEVVIKTLIFLPMAISMIGSSVIWRFVYAYSPGPTQIGLLNAITTAFGAEPMTWLTEQPINTYLLIVILIWMQTGFAVVVFSAALKGVPTELLEAARIDGATEIQSYFRIVIPYIAGTITAVSTTILIFTLKIFDIVLGMTGGNFGTQVIANEQYSQMFRSFDFGRGSAIAIILLITVVPVIYYNLREFSSQIKEA